MLSVHAVDNGGNLVEEHGIVVTAAHVEIGKGSAAGGAVPVVFFPLRAALEHRGCRAFGRLLKAV